MREMKDSGIEWIGDIPAQWGKKKIKNAVSLIGSGTTPTSGNYLYYEDGDIFWIQSGDIYGKSVVTDTSVKITEYAIHSVSALRMYDPPYIVVAMYGGSVGNIAISQIYACVNQACCCIKQNSENDLKYLYYWLISCREDFLRTSEGGGQPNISQAKIKNQSYIQPPLAEQKRIADFLDGKCAEIDALVADIQSQIDTLEQYKRSVITETVTKGVNPDVEMKDSGIEWVGMMPNNWNTSKIKYIAEFAPHCGVEQLKPDSVVGYAPMECIKKGYFIERTAAYNTIPNSLTPFENGDIVMAKVTPCFENGNIAIMENLQSGIGFGSSELFVLRPKTINTKYLFYWLQNDGFIKKAASTMTGMGGLKRVSPKFVQDSFICIPTVAEQKRIADYLDGKCTEIDSIIDQKREQLTVLENYKKSLIYEYVTGKKEVPVQ